MARRQQQNEAGIPELQERVVSINRVAKVVKGGRRMSLTALVVVGDGNGRVGVGMGKSKEVPTAISKGVEDAKKNMFKVSITDEGTVPHEMLGIYGAGRVLIRPAIRGTGVKAGGPVRAVMELAGITDVITKSLGTSNAMNIVKAAAEGLRNMQSPEEVASRRGVSVDYIWGRKEKAADAQAASALQGDKAPEAAPEAVEEAE
jgi:small subunit ribosomal protein S5